MASPAVTKTGGGCVLEVLRRGAYRVLSDKNVADCRNCRAAVRAAVGDATFELLVAYLVFIRTAHYWTEMHPELTYEPDMAEILRGYGELAAWLLDKSEAELIRRYAPSGNAKSPQARGGGTSGERIAARVWVVPTFRLGGPVVVADTQTSPLILAQDVDQRPNHRPSH
jgi:hypothetical protein